MLSEFVTVAVEATSNAVEVRISADVVGDFCLMSCRLVTVAVETVFHSVAVRTSPVGTALDAKSQSPEGEVKCSDRSVGAWIWPSGI